MSRNRNRRRSGFTLVEMLVVIAIIVVLAGILIPTISGAIRRGKNTVIAAEISSMALAVEEYKSKYHDYPPDFSNPTLVRAHFDLLFPRRDRSLDPNWTLIDPAEAIVFCLGGYSDNAQAPFTGSGGPLVIVSGAYFYNINRNVGPMGFDEGRLTITANASGNYMSNDEGTLHNDATQNDPFPVYKPPQVDAPYVYFESRSYKNIPFGSAAPYIGPQYPPPSLQSTSPMTSRAYPYYTDPIGSAPARYINDKTFQILCAGLDNNYGAPDHNKRFPSRFGFDIPSRADDDNLSNFSAGVFEDSYP